MKKKRSNKFTIKMRKKLVVTFMMILLAFVGLSYRLYAITRDDGERYKKQILSQQRYDGTTIPYKRGSILDANGNVLATSEKVYNVILDSVALLEKEEYLEPTLNALSSEFGLDTGKIRSYIAANGETSRYYVLAKRLEYEQIQNFVAMQNETDSLIKGVWFENEYKRTYPGKSLACDVIGFTTNDNIGSYGLEEYYNDVLSGTAGREYGYLNDDSNLERTTISPEDGNTIISTIDINIQSIVEKYLKKFDEDYRDNAHEGNGANNIGCIIMDVNSGEVLAMASYPVFDLNDVRNTEALKGMRLLNAEGKKSDPAEYINDDNLRSLENDSEAMYQNLNALWKNFCINDTYEPGSVSKPFTVAAGIESGSITGNESYTCNGSLTVVEGDKPIKCHNTWGDGTLTVSEGIMLSCNVNMMYIAQATGVSTFTKFQHIFNFGLKTNIDLAGEARTVGLTYTADNMRAAELATCSFGQGYNCTMIQMMAGFCSLINGGYYYEPHMVKKIVSPSGATVQNIEPRLLKQTVSESTSAKVREMCNLVVSGEKGTGRTARPAGYMIGGKTGTAETLPRGNKEYVVSFLGYAPVDDPEIAIYVVVDRPNVPGNQMDDAKFATRIVKSILTEVLPYKGIFMTEELSDKEIEELEALKIDIMTPPASADDDGDGNGDDAAGGNGNGEGAAGGEGTGEDGNAGGEGAGGGAGNEGEGSETAPSPPNEVWKDFPVDPATGYLVDPDTGAFVDPETGAVLGGSFDSGVSTSPPPVEGEDGQGASPSASPSA